MVSSKPDISLRDSVVVVTGASGFIGRHLVARLCDLKADVHGIARSELSFTHKRYHSLSLDLVKYNAVKRTFGALKPDFVFHLASHVMGAPDLRHVIPAFRANLASCVHVLSACAETNVANHRVVLTGSLVEPPPEQMETVPSSPYAAAKWAASSYARMFHALYALPTNIARVFMVYGPAQRDESKLVPYFVKTLLAGRTPKLTSGTRLIDWIYVSDVVEGFIAIATTPGIEGDSIDLGSGQLIATRDFVTKIAELADTPLRPEIGTLPDRPMEPVFRADVQRTFETIGWRPKTSLEQGLTQVIDWQGHWVTHPVQNNMYGLPTDLVTKVICEFADLKQEEQASPANYEEWLLGSYGATFSQTFPMVYTLKYHTTAAANMSTEWIGPRMYRPSLSEVVRGSLVNVTPNIHYVTHFRYPTRGGFMSYIHPFAQPSKSHFNHRLVRLDPKEHRLEFSNGATFSYDGVVSSIPLPDLIPLIEGAPPDVIEAAEKLACTTCVLVNIGVARPDVSGVHISYFYDPDIVFTRVSFPHKMSPNNAPPGTSSIQTEIYGSKKYKPIDKDPDEYIQPVIDDLIRCGLIEAGDAILEKRAMKLDYANIIFDLDRKPSLDTVHGYLDSIGVAYCGRYGDWGYMWTDESFKSGERAAETALSRLS